MKLATIFSGLKDCCKKFALVASGNFYLSLKWDSLAEFDSINTTIVDFS